MIYFSLFKTLSFSKIIRFAKRSIRQEHMLQFRIDSMLIVLLLKFSIQYTSLSTNFLLSNDFQLFFLWKCTFVRHKRLSLFPWKLAKNSFCFLLLRAWLREHIPCVKLFLQTTITFQHAANIQTLCLQSKNDRLWFWENNFFFLWIAIANAIVYLVVFCYVPLLKSI